MCQIDEYLGVKMCRCYSTENKSFEIYLSKFKYNNNKNNDQATWNRSELVA